MFVALVLLPCMAAHGVDAFQFQPQFQPNVTILGDDIIYDVKSDGAYTLDETVRLRINTEQGIKERSQLPLGYSASLQKMDVLEAFTTTRDGKQVAVSLDDIKEQLSPQSAGAPMFDDVKVKTIIFPAVEVGSTLTAHWRRTQVKALFPGHFSAIEGDADTDEVQQESITVRAPASLKIFADAVSMAGGRVESVGGERQEWRWEAKNLPAHAPEVGPVGGLDRSPRVAVTTFPDYSGVGAAYSERASSKSEVTPSIQALADEITKGISDKRKQAEAIYRWVSLNIRYVAIFLDFGGVIPHDAQAVADAKYGDCKDHVTLLSALLSAKAIKSRAVLVNSTDVYWTPKVAAAPGVFDHAISYLPDFDVYLDSTANTAMFGELPFTEQGKTALIIGTSGVESKLVTLPVNDSSRNRIDIQTKLDISESGEVHGVSEFTNTGTFDYSARALTARFRPGIETQFGSRALAVTGQNGTGAYHYAEMHNLSKPFVYSSEFSLPGYLQLPGPGAFVVPMGLNSFSGIATTFDQFGPMSRSFAMPWAARLITETITVHLPKNMKVISLPKTSNVASDYGSYKSSYALHGSELIVVRTINVDPGSPLVKPSQYGALRSMGEEVMRDLRTQVLYE